MQKLRSASELFYVAYVAEFFHYFSIAAFAFRQLHATWTRHKQHDKSPLPATWAVEEYDDACFIVRDANGQALSYIYCESEPGRRSAAKLLTKDEARRPLAPTSKPCPQTDIRRPRRTTHSGIASNIAKLPELLRK